MKRKKTKVPEAAPQPTYALAFSVKYRRPGCVLLQALHGGTVPSELFWDMFPPDTWLVGGDPGTPGGATEDIRTYPATKEQLEALSALAMAAVKREHELRKAGST